jgi:hypothetical protein
MCSPPTLFLSARNAAKAWPLTRAGSAWWSYAPDCQTQVQVPAPRLDEAELSDEDTGGDELGVDLAERVRLLERFHALDQERLQQISAEMGLIQAALDRVVTLLNDAQTPPPGE